MTAGVSSLSLQPVPCSLSTYISTMFPEECLATLVSLPHTHHGIPAHPVWPRSPSGLPILSPTSSFNAVKSQPHAWLLPAVAPCNSPESSAFSTLESLHTPSPDPFACTLQAGRHDSLSLVHPLAPPWPDSVCSHGCDKCLAEVT